MNKKTAVFDEKLKKEMKRMPQRKAVSYANKVTVKRNIGK